MAPRIPGVQPSQAIDMEYHQSALALLPEYVMDQVLGRQPRPEWQPLERHLASCAACRAEHDALLADMRETYSGTLPAVDFTPSLPPFLPARSQAPFPPPLSPAPPAPPAPPPYHIAFSAALLTQMRVRMAARGGELRLRYAYSFPTLKADDPAITIEVLSADEHAVRGLARVCVELADRPPFDQAGSTVTLSCGELALSGVTDRSGLVVFPDVALDAIADWQISVVPPPTG